MNFKVLIGDKRNVDFNMPIYTTPEEKEKFMQLMKSIFDSNIVQEENVEEFRDWRMGGDRIQYPRDWTAEEYEVLLKARNIEEAVDKLGRSGMAILVQAGIWRTEFFMWCDKKGKNPFEENTLEIIKEFMKEKKNELMNKKTRKKELRRNIKDLEKEIIEINNEIKQYDSETKKNQISFLMEMGKIPKEEISTYIEKNKNILFNNKEILQNKLKSLRDES